MAIKYWVGNSGNWNDSSHWSLSSGGPSGTDVPNINDDIYFTSNSFSSENQTVTLSSGEFATGIITSTCRNFTLDISEELVCHNEFTIENDSTILGTFKLNDYAIWNGAWVNSALIETLHCMPYSIIKGNNTITNLILDTNNQFPSAAFYFDMRNNQTIQTFNILNTSSNSQAHIEVRDLIQMTFTHTPQSRMYYDGITTLTWTTTGADYCILDNDIGVVPANGSIDITPSAGTIYTLTAHALINGYNVEKTIADGVYILKDEYIETSIVTTALPISGAYIEVIVESPLHTDTNIQTTALPISGAYIEVIVESPLHTDTNIQTTALPISGAYYVDLRIPTFSGLQEFDLYSIDDMAKTLTIIKTGDLTTYNIYYTLDETEPTSASILYEGPIPITADLFVGESYIKELIVKAVIFSAGYYSPVGTSITYKLIPENYTMLIPNTEEPQIIASSDLSVMTTAMPVSGAYEQVII